MYLWSHTKCIWYYFFANLKSMKLKLYFKCYSSTFYLFRMVQYDETWIWPQPHFLLGDIHRTCLWVHLVNSWVFRGTKSMSCLFFVTLKETLCHILKWCMWTVFQTYEVLACCITLLIFNLENKCLIFTSITSTVPIKGRIVTNKLTVPYWAHMVIIYVCRYNCGM